MNKLLFLVIITVILIYIVIYKTILITQGELIRYIINPVIWIFFALLAHFIFGKKKSYKYQYDVIFIALASSLFYLIIFYILGFFIGYTKNPYSYNISGLVINSFSILMIIGIKEYIRNILLVETNNYSFWYILLILFVFILSDLNFLVLIKSFSSVTSTFNIIGSVLIPVISINIFMTYLCKKGGFLPALLYRLIIISPTVLIPIIPDYEWIIPTLFDVLIPVFTFLLIQYIISKQDKTLSQKEVEQFNPRNWAITFGVTLLLIMFGLGVFSYKPVVIMTASMEPLIKPGDLVIIKEIDIDSIKAGNIIQYKIKDYNVVHRVINKLEDRNGISLITKGDNNKNIDRLPVGEDQLVGRMEYKIPLIGYPSYLLQKMFRKRSVDVDVEK